VKNEERDEVKISEKLTGIEKWKVATFPKIFLLILTMC
jgi:hypothetical protein